MFCFWPPWLHSRHPYFHAPPRAAFIWRSDLRTRYHKRHGRIHIMSTASLTWTLPTTRTDGAALPPDQIASISIFDSASATPDVPITVTQGAATSFTTDVLAVGVHNFTVIVNDTTGHSSAASNTASVTVPATLANPAAVTDLAAVLNP